MVALDNFDPLRAVLERAVEETGGDQDFTPQHTVRGVFDMSRCELATFATRLLIAAGPHITPEDAIQLVEGIENMTLLMLSKLLSRCIGQN